MTTAPTFRSLVRSLIGWSMALTMLCAGMTLGALGLAYSMSGDLYDYQDTVDGVRLPEVDAIVCLAGGRGRIAAAGDIWYRYWELAHSPLIGAGRKAIADQVPILYLSGMGKGSGLNALKKQLRRGVL
jgi:hypothetical protein